MGTIPRERRRELIDIQGKLSVRRQSELLNINRGHVYYTPAEPKYDEVTLLNQIRDIWLRYPFYGYRRITKELRSQGIDINRKRVQRLMQLGGIQALFAGPNTSKRNKQHAIYRYLLGDMAITEPNQVWMVDITYLRMPKGFMYLTAIIDVYSRYVVSWSLSNTLETDSCLDALADGLHIATPTIVNSDQGCQFTSDAWTSYLEELNIKISMTGKGRCLDNVYIERFWRSFKQEEFYLNEYNNVAELKQAIKQYIEFYNHKRWHQSLGDKRPAEVYYAKTGDAVPVDMCTSPSDQPAPFGACGHVMDNANALPTT